MDESERYRRDAAEMQKFMDSMRLEEDGSSDEHVLAKRRRLEEAALLMPTAVKSEMGTMTDESEFDHAKLLERLDRSLDRSAFLSMERDKAEKERMAAEEKAKAAQREMERVKKWAEVQVENNKKDFESVCKREAKLSELVKEKDVEIQAIKIELKARLTVEVRGLFFVMLLVIISRMCAAIEYQAVPGGKNTRAAGHAREAAEREDQGAGRSQEKHVGLEGGMDLC